MTEWEKFVGFVSEFEREIGGCGSAALEIEGEKALFKARLLWWDAECSFRESEGKLLAEYCQYDPDDWERECPIYYEERAFDTAEEAADFMKELTGILCLKNWLEAYESRREA